MEIENKIFLGNCLEILTDFPKDSVNLVFTSPPYAQQRQGFYNSISTEEFPEYTLKWMNLTKPSLKQDGSIIINIREHEKDGVQDAYVLKTVLHLIENGWFWCGKFIWHKTTAPPLGSKKRLRRAFEDLYWFAPTNKPYINPKAHGKTGSIGFENKKYFESKLCDANTKRKDGIVRSTDVFAASVNKNKKGNIHPAQFPEDLSDQIIKIFCPEKGLVLDPFLGSGTTAVSAKKQNKYYCGVELNPAYVKYAEGRISEAVFQVHSCDESPMRP